MSNQTYREALESARRAGIAHCTDAELMAAFLDSTGQILLGAVSPRLVWEGAMAKGLTSKDLTALIDSDPQAAADLMWAAP